MLKSLIVLLSLMIGFNSHAVLVLSANEKDTASKIYLIDSSLNAVYHNIPDHIPYAMAIHPEAPLFYLRECPTNILQVSSIHELRDQCNKIINVYSSSAFKQVFHRLISRYSIVLMQEISKLKLNDDQRDIIEYFPRGGELSQEDILLLSQDEYLKNRSSIIHLENRLQNISERNDLWEKLLVADPNRNNEKSSLQTQLDQLQKFKLVITKVDQVIMSIIDQVNHYELKPLVATLFNSSEMDNSDSSLESVLLGLLLKPEFVPCGLTGNKDVRISDCQGVTHSNNTLQILLARTAQPHTNLVYREFFYQTTSMTVWSPVITSSTDEEKKFNSPSLAHKECQSAFKDFINTNSGFYFSGYSPELTWILPSENHYHSLYRTSESSKMPLSFLDQRHLWTSSVYKEYFFSSPQPLMFSTEEKKVKTTEEAGLITASARCVLAANP